MALGGLGLVAASCAPAAGMGSERGPVPRVDSAELALNSRVGRVPSDKATVSIVGIGQFEFEPGEVASMRPDIFQPRHFSLFDVLVHLDERGDIRLNYHRDEGMDTHVIEDINGQGGWWYRAHYSAGWFEQNVFRMDMYPFKDGTRLEFFQAGEERVSDMLLTFQDEVARLARAAGEVIIPDLEIEGLRQTWSFRDVAVSAHEVRSDVLRPGVITALDVLLSLRDRGEISELKLAWYDRIGRADPVDSYWVEQINEAEAQGGCGFVYETGPRKYSGFAGSHIHIPADVRAIVSPEYALWFWICL